MTTVQLPQICFDDVRGEHLLIALSGGADSVALLLLLLEFLLDGLVEILDSGLDILEFLLLAFADGRCPSGALLLILLILNLELVSHALVCILSFLLRSRDLCSSRICRRHKHYELIEINMSEFLS